MVNLKVMETIRITVAHHLPMGQISTGEMMAQITLTMLNGQPILETESRIPNHCTILVSFFMDAKLYFPSATDI